MIRFTCECGRQLQARDENAGQTVRCPECGREQVLPPVSADAVQPEEAPLAPAAGRESVQRQRPAGMPPAADEDLSVAAAGTSGKATASLVLGLLSFLFVCFTGLPAILVGILALRDVSRSRGRLSGQGLAIAGIIIGCLGTLCGLGLLPVLLIPATLKVREAANRLSSANNLKQMGLAMHNYNSMNGGRFPAAAICDKNGRPLLSWRVAILPYLEQQQLYSQFKLDEPWDGPNNKRLLALMPKVYRNPADGKSPPDHTVYQVFVGDRAAFQMCNGRTIRDFPDGMASTIMIVEAAQAVPWTKPDDLPFDPNRPLPALGGYFASGYNVALMDGAVHFFPKDTPEQTLRLFIMRNDGTPVQLP